MENCYKDSKLFKLLAYLIWNNFVEEQEACLIVMIVVVQDAGMESDDNKPFYEEDEDEEEEVEKNKKPVFKLLLDQDHKLLLRNAKPLLQSRNASVSYQSQHYIVNKL